MKHGDIPPPGRLSAIGNQRRNRQMWRKLMRDLDQRQEEHGHAYVWPSEAAWLTGWHLNQPGHTRYAYSTPGEDLSDAAQGEEAAPWILS